MSGDMRTITRPDTKVGVMTVGELVQLYVPFKSEHLNIGEVVELKEMLEEALVEIQSAVDRRKAHSPMLDQPAGSKR